MPPLPRQAARKVAAVSRALAVLDALAEGGELGTNELARRTGVNASTVSRLLATLAVEGYVDQAANGRYRLGVRLVQLGNTVLDRLDLRELSQPSLLALVAATGETATLSVPGEGEAMTIDFVRSPSSVQGVAQVGRPSVAHATGTGKVMLAFGGAPIPAGPLQRYTTRTVVDPTQAGPRDRAGPSEGLGRGDRRAGGRSRGGRGARAGSRGELAAILGVQGPMARFDAAARAGVLEQLLAATASLSARLGWAPA